MESSTTDFFSIIVLSIIIEFFTSPFIMQLSPIEEFSIFPFIFEFIPIIFLFFLVFLSAANKSHGKLIWKQDLLFMQYIFSFNEMPLIASVISYSPLSDFFTFSSASKIPLTNEYKAQLAKYETNSFGFSIISVSMPFFSFTTPKSSGFLTLLTNMEYS